MSGGFSMIAVLGNSAYLHDFCPQTFTGSAPQKMSQTCPKGLDRFLPRPGKEHRKTIQLKRPGRAHCHERHGIRRTRAKRGPFLRDNVSVAHRTKKRRRGVQGGVDDTLPPQGEVQKGRGSARRSLLARSCAPLPLSSLPMHGEI